MINYDEMSDNEVTAKILQLRKIAYKIDVGSVFIDHGFCDGACVYTWVDYCDKWGDIGPLIEENGIEIKKSGCESFWYAQFGQCHSGFQFNPKRAAAICVIKILEDNNDQP